MLLVSSEFQEYSGTVRTVEVAKVCFISVHSAFVIIQNRSCHELQVTFITGMCKIRISNYSLEQSLILLVVLNKMGVQRSKMLESSITKFALINSILF